MGSYGIARYVLPSTTQIAWTMDSRDRFVDDYLLTEFAADAAELDIGESVEDATDGAVGVTPPSQ